MVLFEIFSSSLTGLAVKISNLQISNFTALILDTQNQFRLDYSSIYQWMSVWVLSLLIGGHTFNRIKPIQFVAVLLNLGMTLKRQPQFRNHVVFTKIYGVFCICTVFLRFLIVYLANRKWCLETILPSYTMLKWQPSRRRVYPCARNLLIRTMERSSSDNLPILNFTTRKSLGSGEIYRKLVFRIFTWSKMLQNVIRKLTNQLADNVDSAFSASRTRPM